MKPIIKNQKSKIKNHPAAVLILLFFIILAVIYSLVTPPLEAGDESRHYAVVKYMADTGRLPVQERGEAQIHWSHEGNQPPLYYALAALLTFWIDTGDWNDVFLYNPHTTIGDPLRPDNKNITIHPPAETWPWSGHVLAVHLIRFLSIIMAAVTVSTGYLMALSLFKGNRWLAAGAMAVTAFNPMFLFISAAVNNDNAVIMFVTLALWLMIQIGESANRRIDESQNQQIINNNFSFILHPSSFILRSAILLGLLIGLGALSKLYALGLLPLAGLLFLWLAYQNDHTPFKSDHVPHTTHHALRLLLPAFTWTALMVIIVLLVAGWFYARNAFLYGDPLALNIMNEVAGQRKEAPTLATIQAEFEGFRIAYWALFGGVNILADNWIYKVLDWVSLIAIFGVVGFIVSSIKYYASVRSLPPPAFFILFIWCSVMIAGFIVWNFTILAGQGRLLFPAITAFSALGILGLTWWLPASGQKFVVTGFTIFLLVFATLSPFFYITPAYTKPPRLTKTELPADLQPVNFTYDGKMRLLGYYLYTPTVHPAETLSLTLYWQLLEPADLNYSIFIHLLGRGRQVVSQIDTYPGGGHWPTTLLSPGDILADRYEIPIPPEAERSQAPTRLLIAAGIYDFNETGRPGKPVVNAAGEPVEPIIASAKLIPWQWPDPPPSDTPVNFADKVILLSHKIAADQLSVTLNWQVKALFDTDYTVFLQLWQTNPNIYVRGFDGPPLQGDYPTSLWAPGEMIADTHSLNLAGIPAGEYYLLAGLYHPTTGERLPASTSTGPLPDYAVNLGPFQVK